MKLPTYQEAKAICKANPVFFEKVEVLENHTQVFIFGSRLPSYTDFYDENGNETHALELRGLSYVQNTHMDYEVYPALRKFFNIDQTPGSMIEDVQDLEIQRIQDKCDGSMINFVYTGNRFLAKSKMTFSSDQAKLANTIYHNHGGIQTFLRKCADGTFGRVIYPIFELVSPLNKIVLDYENTELILLQMRDENGDIVDFYGSDWQDRLYDLSIPMSADLTRQNTLDNILNIKRRLSTEIEGWVVTFTNGKQIKIKTDWYFQMHKLVTENLVAENGIIEMVLNETLDDVISQVDANDPRRKYAEAIASGFNQWFAKSMKTIERMIKLYGTYDDRKTFVEAFNDTKFFSIIMASLNRGDAEDNLKKYMLKKTRKLTAAREFVEKELNILNKGLTLDGE